MKKETKIICGSVLAFLIILFGIVAIIIHESPQIQRETHPTDITVNEFVRQIAPAAQREQKKYHIPASITIAQAGLESNWGRSRLANKYNNLFGIKANSDDEKVQMYTTENIRGKNVQVKQYFTVYNSWADSINAHTLLIVNGTADNHARFHGVQTAKTYQQVAYELQRNGYATDPDYASKLIYAIKKFNLAQYDNVK